MIPVDDLSAEERIRLIGELWDSLDPAAAAPLTPDLAEELERREAEAEATPDEGASWAETRDALRKQIT